MTENPFRSFILCVEFDQQILQLQQRIEQFQEEISVAQLQADALVQRAHEERTAFMQLKAQVAAQEYESLTLGQRETKLLSQQMLAGTPKEFLSIEHELKDTRAKRELSEHMLFVLFEQLEAAQSVFEQCTVRATQASAERDTLSADRERLIANRLHEIAVVQEQRDQCAATAHSETLDKYHRMLAKTSNPVVPLQDTACSACGFQVLSAEYLAMRKNVLITCSECYRLLYIK